jgi:hypothetical protein
MDCRTFHQKLEDYLENGLDFAGRFGMERHAQQCISCGKELQDARQLRQMVSELQRVKAPANFEASIMRKIAVSKANSRFSGIRKFWIYGFEWPSWQKLALASSSLAVLGLAIFFASHRIIPDPVHAPAQVAAKPANVTIEAKGAKPDPVVKVQSSQAAQASVPKKRVAAESQMLASRIPPARLSKSDGPKDQEMQDEDYVEYMMTGADNRPVPVRLPLPRTITMPYGQVSQEYFIQNASH